MQDGRGMLQEHYTGLYWGHLPGRTMDKACVLSCWSLKEKGSKSHLGHLLPGELGDSLNGEGGPTDQKWGDKNGFPLSLFRLISLGFPRNTEETFSLHPTPAYESGSASHTWIAGFCGHQTLKSVTQCIIKCLFKFIGGPGYLSLLIHSPLGMKGKQKIHFTKIITFTYFYHELNEWF